MKRKIFFYFNLTLLFIVSISCVHEQYRSVNTGEEKVFVTFNPTNILTTGTETQINKFRMIAFNSGGTLEFNKKQSEMDSPSKNLYKLELRPGMYTLYGIGNEPDELLTQLDEVRTSDALDAIKLGDVRSIPENNLPLIWKRTIYIRATGLDASVGQVSLTNSPDDSGWSSTLPMQMERIAAKISIAARKGNPNEEINMTQVEIRQIPAYTTFAPSVYPAGERFYSNNFEWGGPKLITGDADSYTELVKGQIVAENLPATEARKTIISIEYTRNGIAESAAIPFDGNVDRNKLYQYQIKITGIQVEIENITVLPWNEASTDIIIPGVEINFSQVEVPYSLGQESKVFFTTKNIHPDNLNLSTGVYDSKDGTTLIGNLYDYFDASTQYTYSYDPATRTGRGELTIKRKKATLDKHRINIYASGLTRSILVNGLGVAGSNVYWDTTHNQLAFDDTPGDGERAAHDIYQGVFFYQGGLTALPGGYYGKGPKKNYIWSSTGVVSSNTTPYYTHFNDVVNGKFPFLPDSGKGDICEYMTRRGWAPQGKKWRLPNTELSLAKEYIIEGNSSRLPDPGSAYGDCEASSYLRFNNITLPHTSYVHLYMGGMQNTGNYRSFYCRQYQGNVTSLYDVTNKVNSYTLNTYYGMAVRCVVDDTPGEVTPLYVVSYDLSGSEAGTVTAPTPEGIILNQHTDKGGSVILSNDTLQASTPGYVHRGWLINGQRYKFGATIKNITQDIIVKPDWMIWATGNLIADGKGGCKIGAPTDNGLFFQPGSLVGWGGSYNVDGTGYGTGYGTLTDGRVQIPNMSPVVQPTDCYSTWSDDYYWKPFTKHPPGTLGTNGNGDPCRYYLGGNWRVPNLDDMMYMYPLKKSSYTNSSVAISSTALQEIDAQTLTDPRYNLTFRRQAIKQSTTSIWLNYSIFLLENAYGYRNYSTHFDMGSGQTIRTSSLAGQVACPVRCVSYK